MSDSPKIKVAIIGAGISGLAVANGLLRHDDDRFDVQIYDRDTIAFDSERGGYQIRISGNGLGTLKKVSTEDTWSSVVEMWGGDDAKAPAMVNPTDLSLCLNLSNIKLYPQSRPIPRSGLRRALLQRPMQEDRLRFGHRLERFVVNEGDNAGVTLYFADKDPIHADIVIGADGSSSVVNRQVGLNNKVKLQQWTLFQARGVVDSATRSRLPETLTKMGAFMYLGGSKLSGYASIYRHEGQSASQDESTLFWSMMIPGTVGQPIIQKADGDTAITMSMLDDYLTNDLKLEGALPSILNSVTTNLRTGLLTSSIRPDHDWRKGIASNARVILLGDAIHPMTPGRGMGANQALVDAGNLVDLFRQSTATKATLSDKSLKALVDTFDAEMFDRAFKVVKASEDVTGLDLMRAPTRLLVYTVGAVLTVLGWGATVLESVGLKQAAVFDYVNQNA